MLGRPMEKGILLRRRGLLRLVVVLEVDEIDEEDGAEQHGLAARIVLRVTTRVLLLGVLLSALVV